MKIFNCVDDAEIELEGPIIVKLRHRVYGYECISSEFNIFSINEIVIYKEDDCDSDYINNYDVWLEIQNKWMSLNDAFKEGFIVTDEYNTIFYER